MHHFSLTWFHHGLDPFAEDELESGRLPKIIDAWLNAQIEAGKDTESIRKLLQMTDEEKAEVGWFTLYLPFAESCGIIVFGNRHDRSHFGAN